MASEQKGLQPKDAGDGKQTRPAGRRFDTARDAHGSGRPGEEIRSILTQQLGNKPIFGFSESPTDGSLASSSDSSARSKRPTNEDLHMANAAWYRTHSPARGEYLQSVPIRDATAREPEQPDSRKQKKQVSIDRKAEERTFSKDKAISEDKGKTTKIEVDPLDRDMSEKIKEFTTLRNDIKSLIRGEDKHRTLELLDKNLNTITDQYYSENRSNGKQRIYRDMEKLIGRVQGIFDDIKRTREASSPESMQRSQSF